MRNNEEIIRIAAELHTTIRGGVVALIEAGAPIDILYPLLEAINRLDHAPSDLIERPVGMMGSELRASGLIVTEPASRLQAEQILETLSQISALSKAKL